MIENLFYATLAVITYLCTLNHREKMKQLQVANVAVSRGGKHLIENLQTLCRSCNSRKGASL